MGYDLHNAAENGDLVSVERLLANGADAHGLNDDGETPLRLAAWRGHSDRAAIMDTIAESRRSIEFLTFRRAKILQT